MFEKNALAKAGVFFFMSMLLIKTKRKQQAGVYAGWELVVKTKY